MRFGFEPGQRVKHATFGLGRVTNVLFEASAYDVQFDSVKGFKCILGVYLEEAPEEPAITVSEPVFNPTQKQPEGEVAVTIHSEIFSTTKSILATAQETARELGKEKGQVHMDMVSLRLQGEHGITADQLGNSAGSVFRGKEWQFTGQFAKSNRPGRRGGAQRIWQYVQAA